jgi:hypothetical protein
MKNWKTTATGITAIVVVLSTAAHNYLATGAIPDIGLVIGSVLAGWGLIVAKDNNARL